MPENLTVLKTFASGRYPETLNSVVVCNRPTERDNLNRLPVPEPVAEAVDMGFMVLSLLSVSRPLHGWKRFSYRAGLREDPGISVEYEDA